MRIFVIFIVFTLLFVVTAALSFVFGNLYANQKTGAARLVIKNDTVHDILVGYEIKESFGPHSNFQSILRKGGRFVFDFNLNSDADMRVFSIEKGKVIEKSDYITRRGGFGFFNSRIYSAVFSANGDLNIELNGNSTL